jgi:hypothetical protein
MRACNRNRHGSRNPSWKGGVKLQKGYMYQHSPNHPEVNANGYVAQHRLVMEKHIGRFLFSTETVHHKNGKRDDNRIENLELRAIHHGQGQRYNDLSVNELAELSNFITNLLVLKMDSYFTVNEKSLTLLVA